MAVLRWLDWPIRVRRLAASLYFSTLTWLLLAPSETFEDVPELFPHADKIVHAGVFLGLAFLVRWAFGRHRVFAALLVYCVAIEVLQPLIGGAGRQFEWLDMACNLAGICCGWLLYGMLRVPEPLEKAGLA